MARQARKIHPEPAMSCRPTFWNARWIARLVHLAAVVTVIGTTSVATAQSVIRVEEDWELVLGAPDEALCGPQVVTTMSPFNNINDTFFTFEINHRSAPYWTPGGLTIHQWSGDWRIQSFDRADRTVMTTTDEVVTWTQALYVNDGVLTFQIIDGASTTWGPFGYSNMFKLIQNWGVNNINSYTPDVSIGQSGPAFAGNRVKSLKIKELRLTLDDGFTLTDTTERVAYLLVE
jgi:hypothetical protein